MRMWVWLWLWVWVCMQVWCELWQRCVWVADRMNECAEGDVHQAVNSSKRSSIAEVSCAENSVSRKRDASVCVCVSGCVFQPNSKFGSCDHFHCCTNQTPGTHLLTLDIRHIKQQSLSLPSLADPSRDSVPQYCSEPQSPGTPVVRGCGESCSHLSPFLPPVTGVSGMETWAY